MSAKSLKVIRSLDRLPPYFKQASAFFLRFKEYQSKDPLISYFAGLCTAQILIDLITTKNSINGEPLVNDEKDITTHLVTVLENERVKLEKDQNYKTILESHQSSREYILDFTNESFETVTTSIETGLASGKTVTDLLNCASLYEIARSLFPFEVSDFSNISFKSIEDGSENEFEPKLSNVPKDEEASKLPDAPKDEEKANETELIFPDVPKDDKSITEKGKVEDENEIKKEINIGKNQEKNADDDDLKVDGKPSTQNNELPKAEDDDLTSSLSKLVQSTTDDTNLEDHISQSIKELSTNNEPYRGNKEDGIIDKIINTTFNKITDDELDERIHYCKKNAQRILTAVKRGENPQISSNSVDNKLISNEEIEKVIKFALNEPDESTEEEIKFPELPTTIPNNQPEDDNDQIVDEVEVEDEDEKEDHIEQPNKPETVKTLHKQLAKEDIEQFLQDGELLTNASKNAKFAISAINYEDVDTAIDQLHKSLAFLEQYKKRN